MIAIENIQSIGPWGYSRDIESLLRKQLFLNDLQQLPWQYSCKSLENQIRQNTIDGIIEDTKLKNSLNFSSEQQKLPRETSLAISLIDLFLKNSEKSRLSMVSATFPTYLPDNHTLEQHLEFPEYSESYSVNANALNYNFPYQLPNQLVSNLAIHFGFQGDILNFCDYHSSYSAVESAMRSIANGLHDEILFIGSLCYSPSIIISQLTEIFQSAADFFNINQISLNEWIGVTRIKKLADRKPNDCVMLALNSYQLNNRSNLDNQVFDYIEELTHSANKSIKDIDLILINDPSNSWLLEQLTILSFFRSDVKIIDFYERLGNSLHCRFIQSLELLQFIFEAQTLPQKIRPNFRPNTLAFNKNIESDFVGQCGLIICPSSGGMLQMGLVVKI